ncbi:MAG: hypothetical protein IPM06_21290 [Rhizobiales bacterium]|nr:hypothetical protein [Hyphomicrobiales bacterium]
MNIRTTVSMTCNSAAVICSREYLRQVVGTLAVVDRVGAVLRPLFPAEVGGALALGERHVVALATGQVADAEVVQRVAGFRAVEHARHAQRVDVHGRPDAVVMGEDEAVEVAVMTNECRVGPVHFFSQERGGAVG